MMIVTNGWKMVMAVAWLACSSSSMVDGSSSNLASVCTSRLPMSLSSVINDLEAEGATSISTATFLSSRGVTKASRASILRTLFGYSSHDDEDEDELKDGKTTAFGMKLFEDASEDDVTKSGVAIANPAVDASVTEVAATVHACGGSVVFLVSPQDLARGEGLFDTLGPALEDLLRSSSTSTTTTTTTTTDHAQGGRHLIVVVEGNDDDDDVDLVAAQKRLEAAAASLLTHLVGSTINKAKSLADVFDGNVTYMSSNSMVDLDSTLNKWTKEPSVAQSTVASAVYKSVNSGYTTTQTLHKSPYDLAAVRKLLPASRKALQSCIATVQQKCDDADGGLVDDFGALCHAALQRSMDQFDAQSQFLEKKSSVARRIRKELIQEMYAELDDLSQIQMNLLHTASFESFQRGLSKLRLSPNLKTDMQRVAKDVIDQYSKALLQTNIHNKNNNSNNSNNKQHTTLTTARLGQLKRELAEYIHLRLQAAKADGKYKPLPRKGITIGMHWLLPKPFGNDYRQDPWKVHTTDDLIYTPADKLTDVNPQDILNSAAAAENRDGPADWTKHIVPAPTGTEMLYLK